VLALGLYSVPASPLDQHEDDEDRWGTRLVAGDAQGRIVVWGLHDSSACPLVSPHGAWAACVGVLTQIFRPCAFPYYHD